MTDETSVEETTAESALAEGQTGVTETPTEEPEEGQEPESEDSDGDSATAKPKGFQKRINQLTRRARELERENEQLRKAREVPEAPQQPKGPPKPEDYGQDYQKYLADLTRYETRQAIAETQQQEQTKAQEKAQQDKLATFLSADEAYAEINADYRGAYELGNDPSFPINQPMLDAIVETDHGPALLHYLDTHRDEAAQIAEMSPARAAVALGRIEARLDTPAPKPVPKPVTKAPPPVPTVKPTAPSRKDPEKMTMAEYSEWRRKQTT